MYKINYNGFQIETDSVNEVENLLKKEKVIEKSIKTPEISTNVVKKGPGRPKGKRKSSRRAYTSGQWTIPEIEYIVENLESFGRNKMSKDTNLLRNHTKGAIGTMCWRVNSAPKHYKRGTKKKVQKVIENYQKKKKSIGFFGDRTRSLLDD